MKRYNFNIFSLQYDIQYLNLILNKLIETKFRFCKFSTNHDVIYDGSICFIYFKAQKVDFFSKFAVLVWKRSALLFIPFIEAYLRELTYYDVIKSCFQAISFIFESESIQLHSSIRHVRHHKGPEKICRICRIRDNRHFLIGIFVADPTLWLLICDCCYRSFNMHFFVLM